MMRSGEATVNAECAESTTVYMSFGVRELSHPFLDFHNKDSFVYGTGEFTSISKGECIRNYGAECQQEPGVPVPAGKAKQTN